MKAKRLSRRTLRLLVIVWMNRLYHVKDHPAPSWAHYCERN